MTTSSTTGKAAWQDIVITTVRLLSFRANRDELIGLGSRHLAFGLLCTWIVGVGRYWDNPRVSALQHSGIGSIIYVFTLSLLLWLIVWPLRPSHWSYFRVVTFVALVSPPAILYAIQVEHFYSIDTANDFNVLFLAIVAIWRVALLLFFLRRFGNLDWFSVFVTTLLPITLIVVTLTVLNLEKVVFDLMGGIRERTASDAAYGVLVFLSYLSILLFLPLLLCYLALAVSGTLERRRLARLERDLKTYE